MLPLLFLGCFLCSCLLGNRLLGWGFLCCFLCRSLLGRFLCGLLGGRLLCCFLNCQRFTSFGGFAGALFHRGLLGCGFSALGDSGFCGGLLRGLFGHNLFSGLLGRSFLGGLLCWSLLCRDFLGGRLFRRGFLGG